MKTHTTALALILALSLVLAPATFADVDEPTVPDFDVVEWITDGLTALWDHFIDGDGPAAEPTSGDEAAGNDGPDDGSGEIGPELVPIG